MGRLLDDPPHTQTLTERQLEEPMIGLVLE